MKNTFDIKGTVATVIPKIIRPRIMGRSGNINKLRKIDKLL
jgi:hypothetical protein